MVFLVVIGVQTLKGVSLLVALLAKEKVVAVLTHPAAFKNHFFAVKTVVTSLLIESRLHHHFKLVITPVIFP